MLSRGSPLFFLFSPFFTPGGIPHFFSSRGADPFFPPFLRCMIFPLLLMYLAPLRGTFSVFPENTSFFFLPSFLGLLFFPPISPGLHYDSSVGMPEPVLFLVSLSIYIGCHPFPLLFPFLASFRPSPPLRGPTFFSISSPGPFPPLPFAPL